MQTSDPELYFVYFFEGVADQFFGLLATFGSDRISIIEHHGNVYKTLVRITAEERTIIRLTFAQRDLLDMHAKDQDLRNFQGYAVDKDSL